MHLPDHRHDLRSRPVVGVERRRLLGAALGAGLLGATAAASAERAAPIGSDAATRTSHFPFGPVSPLRPIPAWPVSTHRSRQTDLVSLLRGHTTALQLMFTGCSATCPIQGALFAQAQRGLPAPARSPLQLLSLSIDPLSDTPAALDGWLRQFTGAPNWLAVAPRVADVDRIFELLGSGGESRPTGPDRHTGQVYIVNRRAELVYRTASMPPPAQIVGLLAMVAERA